MRLEPIEKPVGLWMRVAYWMTRRKLGKVITPMKVVYARMPGVLRLANEMQKFEMKGIRLDPALHFLIATFVSQINGCSFCIDIARAMAVRKHLGTAKFNALADYRTSAAFSDRERAALAYVEEATRQRQVSDATFAALRTHFSEPEIVEITWLNAIHNYYNLINVPLEIEADGLTAIAEGQRLAA